MTRFKVIFIIGIICQHLISGSRAGGYLSYGPGIKGTTGTWVNPHSHDCNKWKWAVFFGSHHTHTGSVWPKPLWQDDSGRYFSANPKNFKMVVCIICWKQKDNFSYLASLPGCQPKLSHATRSHDTLHRYYTEISPRLHQGATNGSHPPNPTIHC